METLNRTWMCVCENIWPAAPLQKKLCYMQKFCSQRKFLMGHEGMAAQYVGCNKIGCSYFYFWSILSYKHLWSNAIGFLFSIDIF